jgi:hypothetical protein
MTRIVRWVAAAVIVTGLFASLYVVIQQTERQGADDSPARLASQVASELTDTGSATGPAGGSAPDVVNIATSDEPFFVVYDAKNRPVAGTGHEDGALPTVPAGVLAEARHDGANHVTWQTSDGRRFATVERLAGHDVVLAAQSLTPTEARIDRLGLLVLIAWACVLAVVVLGFLLELGAAALSARQAA